MYISYFVKWFCKFMIFVFKFETQSRIPHKAWGILLIDYLFSFFFATLPGRGLKPSFIAGDSGERVKS